MDEHRILGGNAMKAGDLVRYGGTGQLYLVYWTSKTHCKLVGFPHNQVFLIKGCDLKVVNESR